MITSPTERATYDIADICALDQQSACQIFILLSQFRVPGINGAPVVSDLLLQVTEVCHVLEVQAHIGC
jgi:hypothetical protein